MDLDLPTKNVPLQPEDTEINKFARAKREIKPSKVDNFKTLKINKKFGHKFLDKKVATIEKAEKLSPTQEAQSGSFQNGNHSSSYAQNRHIEKEIDAVEDEIKEILGEMKFIKLQLLSINQELEKEKKISEKLNKELEEEKKISDELSRKLEQITQGASETKSAK